MSQQVLPVSLVRQGIRVEGRLVYSFSVLGEPIPKGSFKPVVSRSTGRPMLKVHNEARTRSWMDSVCTEGAIARGAQEPINGAVLLFLRFYVPRPPSLPKRVRYPVRKRADLDKLVRTVKDALTRAGTYRDDCVVVDTVSRKRFAGGEHDPLGSAGVPRVDIDVLLVE